MSIHVPLHGDGLSFPLFHLLWTKSPKQRRRETKKGHSSTTTTTVTTDSSRPPSSADDNQQQHHRRRQRQQRRRQDQNKNNENDTTIINDNSSSSSDDDDDDTPDIRIPDTILFQFGQPIHWYFTSQKKNQKATILRKRKQNVTIDKIEKGFLESRQSLLQDEGDVMAYFISKGVEVDDEEEDGDGFDDDGVASIEYFDKKGLQNFLSHGRKERTGILQRFITPSGTTNSLIRAIYTPKITLLERRRNNIDLHDDRYGLYERCITFEQGGKGGGGYVHSSPAPLRGTVLANHVRRLCRCVVEHVADAIAAEEAATTRGGGSGNGGGRRPCGMIDRMVLNFKVDERDRVWLLWSSSIRMDGGGGYIDNNTTAGGGGRGRRIADDLEDKRRRILADPLTIEPLLKLKSHVTLEQRANHHHHNDAMPGGETTTATPTPSSSTFRRCPSCGHRRRTDNFYPVPYKTIIAHFDRVVSLMTTTTTSDNAGEPTTVRTLEWPPDDITIAAAGNVGGFCLLSQNDDEEEEFSKDDVLVPPLVRHCHPRLTLRAFLRYKRDPLFLHKSCDLCDSCFLSYAELASNSFQIVDPVRIDEESRRRRRMMMKGGVTKQQRTMTIDDNEDVDDYDNNAMPRCRRRVRRHQRQGNNNIPKEQSIGRVFAPAPALPPAVSNEDTNDDEGNPSSLSYMEQLMQRRDDSFFQKMTLSATTNDSGNPHIDDDENNNPLLHLIASHMNMEREVTRQQQQQSASNYTTTAKTAVTNPYEIPLTFVGDMADRDRSIVMKKTKKKNRMATKIIIDHVDNNDVDEVDDGGGGGGDGSNEMTADERQQASEDYDCNTAMMMDDSDC